MSSLTADRKSWNSITIDVTIGDVFDYIGLKDFKICHFQPISGRLPERGRKKWEVIDERKNGQTTPTRTCWSTIGPCPTLIQISRKPRHWKLTQRLRTTRPSPGDLKGDVVCGKAEIVTRPCCKRSRCGITFRCTNGEMENGYCSQHVLGYLFPILRPKNNYQ